LPFGSIYISIVRAGLGDKALSFRRALFAILSVLFPLIGLRTFDRQFGDITLFLFGDVGANIVHVSNGVFFDSVSDVFHPLAYDFRWIYTQQEPFYSLLPRWQ
jgi:hypothetical protein